MYRIAYKKDLNEQVTLMKIEAPLIAKKARPGQFIIFRIDEYGERVPLTIVDTDPEAGTVTIIFQKVGLSTNLLGSMNAGDSILDFVGPLGAATDLDGIKKAAVIGGGVGCAIAYPTAKALYQAGAEVDMIAGFRSEDLVSSGRRWRRLPAGSSSAPMMAPLVGRALSPISSGSSWNRANGMTPSLPSARCR